MADKDLDKWMSPAEKRYQKFLDKRVMRMSPSDIPTVDELPKADVSDIMRNYRDTVRGD